MAYSVGMWVQEHTHWDARVGVPSDEHGVVATVGSHDPALVVGAGDSRDLVAVTLQAFLLVRYVVENDSRVGRRVEDFL